MNKELFLLCTERIEWDEFEGKMEDKEIIYKNAVEHRLLDSLVSIQPYFFLNEISTSFKKEKKRKRRYFLDFVDSLNQEKVDYLCLKGLAMRKYYPKSIDRQSNDFDILLKDLNEYWKVHEILLKKGYLLEKYPYFTKYIHYCGVATYRKIIGFGLTIEIEVNIGGFPLSECTWLVEPLLWSTKQTILLDKVHVQIPSNEFNIIILTAEVGSNGKKRIRDAVDLYYLMKSVYDTCFINDYLKKLKLKKPQKVVAKMLSQLEKNTFKNSRSGLLNEIYYRWRTDFFHIIPIYSSNKVLIRLVSHYLRLILIYLVQKDILLNQIMYFDKVFSPTKYIKLGLPVYFIQIDKERNDTFRWITKDSNSIVKTPIGTFMASSLCLHNEEDFEIAANLTKKQSTA